MKAPPFWWQAERGIAAKLLSPLGFIYGQVAARRMGRPAPLADVPTLCVGNLVAGGAGKTPLALSIYNLLKDNGFRPFILSRGYGGRVHDPVLVDGRRHNSAEVGDEPLLMARYASVIVAKNRVDGAAYAVSCGADCLVLDDGFQSPTIGKDYNILAVDGAVGWGNGLCLPAGPLRAPLEVQLRAADAVVIIGKGASFSETYKKISAAGLPLFEAELVADAAVVEQLKGQKVLAFAGIGRPEKFFQTLENNGIIVEERHAFGDHQRLKPAQCAELMMRAVDKGLQLVCTEKDWVRLDGSAEEIALQKQSIALPVQLNFSELSSFQRFMASLGLA